MTMASVGTAEYDQFLRAELTQKLDEILKLVKNERVHGYEERINYEPVIGKHDEVTKYKPINYEVSFIFKDPATGQDVKVTIDTKIGEKK